MISTGEAILEILSMLSKEMKSYRLSSRAGGIGGMGGWGMEDFVIILFTPKIKKSKQITSKIYSE